MAVKSIDEEQMESFKLEISLLKALRPHPNVVQVQFREFSSNFQLYGLTYSPFTIVMEYVSMGSLFALLHSDQEISTEKTKKIIAGVVNGMIHLVLISFMYSLIPPAQ